MNTPKVTIGVVLFGAKYLKQSLPSLLASDYPNLDIILLDQQEGTWEAYDLIHAEMPEVVADPRVRLTKGKNLWHSGGHNVCIRNAKDGGSAYYLAGSNDMLYAPDCISQMIAALEEHHAYSFVAPKLLRWDYEKGEQTDFFDSAGLGIRHSNQVIDRGQGEQDVGQYEAGRVFGASGALVCVRMSALERIAFSAPPLSSPHQGGEKSGDGREGVMEYWDELIHYKNDVELSYRLNWAGEQCLYVPEAVAWHDRQLADRGMRGRLATARWAKESSFFGQLYVLKKHFSSDFTLRTKGATGLDVLKRLAFAVFCEPYQFRQFGNIAKIQPELQQRKEAMKRTASPADIESLMT